MAKAVTLKDKDGNELYPVTSWDLVNQGSSGGDWHCIAGGTLGSAGTSLLVSLPAQYDCYQIIAAGEFASGVSGTWVDLRLLNGSSGIPSTLIQVYRNDQTLTVTTFNDRIWQLNMDSANAYDGFNMNLSSYNVRRGSTYRKFQGTCTLSGSSWRVIECSGRFQSATEPTAVQLISGGNMQQGSYLKVFACNKPA